MQSTMMQAFWLTPQRPHRTAGPNSLLYPASTPGTQGTMDSGPCLSPGKHPPNTADLNNLPS